MTQSEPRFYEQQSFSPWVNVLIVVSMVVPLPIVLLWAHNKEMWPIAVMIILLLLFMSGVIGIMRTTIDEVGIHVVFGYFGWIKYHYAWPDLIRFEARTYKPLIEYGGWGIRGFGNRIALNMRGNRGVELFLRNTKSPGERSVMIGSQNPEDFAAVCAFYAKK